MPLTELSAGQLDQRHPHYEARISQWTWNHDHYLGGRQLVSKTFLGKDVPVSPELPDRYLRKYPVETEESYQTRLESAPGLYDNLVRRSLNIYQSQLFAVEPNRNLGPMEEMIENVDLEETDANAFFKHTTEFAQLMGINFVLVDAPRLPEIEGRAVTEMDAADVRPFFEEVPAQNVIDWEVEKLDPLRRGRLNWVVIKDEVHARPNPGAHRRVLTRYRVWSLDEWAILFVAVEGDDDEPMVVDASGGPNLVGEVPLVPFYDDRISPMQGGTIMDDVTLSTNALWNRASAEDDAFLNQAFNEFVLKSDSLDITDLKFGVSRGFQIGQADEAAYLTPSDVPFEAFDRFVKRQVEKINDLVFSRTNRQMPTGQVESAEKRDIDRAEFMALLESKAARFEKAELECWRLAAMYMGHEEIEMEVTYNRDFSVDEETPQNWQVKIQAGVRSRVEWYQAEHPGTEEDEAKQKLEENLAYEREIGVVEFEVQAELQARQTARMQEIAGEAGGGENEGGGETPPQEGKQPPQQQAA
jgi:hypothetical protein